MMKNCREGVGESKGRVNGLEGEGKEEKINENPKKIFLFFFFSR